MFKSMRLSITALLLLGLALPAPRGDAGEVIKNFYAERVPNQVLNILKRDHTGPTPAISQETAVDASKAGYKKIRKRYRILEFFSLGFLLIMAVIVTVYLLRIKERSEKARKLKAEIYSVEELDNRASIENHFEGLMQNRSEFTVQFEGIEEQFATTPRSLQEEGKIFMTEALLPSPGKGLNLTGANVKIDYLYNSVPYSFVTQLLLEPQAAEDPVAFRSPQLIKYTQRRHAYRVKPPVLEPVTLIFSHPGGKVPESVMDLSTGGFSLKSEIKYNPDTTYREVRLLLPGIKPLKVDVKCVYHLPSGSSEEEKAVRFGFEFVSPGVMKEKTLMGFVSFLRWRKDDR
jgi:c-di-GMP-binding flagellar brake protein YcgR